MQKRRPVMLVVLDGFGWREESADNAVRQAKTPTFDRLWNAGPHAFLNTSGRDVGLPPGQMGNSEVGHLNIGAGRVVMQDLPRISDAVASGEIKNAPALKGLIEAMKKSGGTCHLIGLVSPGGVHSHQDHGAALAKILTDAGIPTVAHAITDGRDTPPQSAGDDLKRFVAALPNPVPVATVVGRYYAMDRDKRWERVSKAYAAMVEAEGPHFPDPQAAIADAYSKKQFDEFVIPAVIGDYRGMKDGDGLVFFNFRSDRAREILAAIGQPGFDAFDTGELTHHGEIAETGWFDPLNLPDAVLTRPSVVAVFDSVKHEIVVMAPVWPTDADPAVAGHRHGPADGRPDHLQDGHVIPLPRVGEHRVRPRDRRRLGGARGELRGRRSAKRMSMRSVPTRMPAWRRFFSRKVARRPDS